MKKLLVAIPLVLVLQACGGLGGHRQPEKFALASSSSTHAPPAIVLLPDGSDLGIPVGSAAPGMAPGPAQSNQEIAQAREEAIKSLRQLIIDKKAQQAQEQARK